MLTLFIVSDGTGETAHRVVQAGLTQFHSDQVRVERHASVRTPELVREVVQQAGACQAVVVHTLVSHELRRVMLHEARLRGVDAMDLMGPVLDRLAMHLQTQPQEQPGLLEQLIAAKSRQIEAFEFAVHHDDGRNVEELGRSEIVLVGPSRTMKTPTTFHLAYRGWFCANVPLVAGMSPPEPLVAVPPERVFGLLIAPERLLDLRHARASVEKIPPETYASPASIRDELRHTRDLCARYNWRRLEVTGKSVEELSQEILSLLGETRIE